MEHTELPWKIKWQHKGGWTIGTDNDALIEVSNVDIGHKEAEKIAEYIVRARNAFPALMDAIKEIDDFYENSVGQVITTERAIDAYHKSTMADKIKAALAAGGE